MRSQSIRTQRTDTAKEAAAEAVHTRTQDQASLCSRHISFEVGTQSIGFAFSGRCLA